MRARMNSREWACCLLLTVSLGTAPAGAVPGNPNASGGTTEKTGHGFGWVNQSIGVYQDEIEIEVPEFHDLEPDLSLSYSSGGGNGYAGVGWALDGISLIERSGPERGAPTFTAQDVWLLDGARMLPCPSAQFPSPSCQTGGTHYTEAESFQRIRRVDGSSEEQMSWVVTDRDGTESTFRSGDVVTVDGTRRVVRYVPAEDRDVLGNRIEYVWGHDLIAAGWTFPTAIRYRRAIVEFHWETRPDQERYANGVGLSVMPGRIKSILVWALDENGGRTLQRAYRLAYTTSPRTARSLLVSVQEFGGDAVLTADGNGQIAVTGGTSNPPTTLGYSASTPGDYDTHVGDIGLPNWCPNATGDGSSGQHEFAGDFDGDGRTDLGCRIAGVQYVAYSRADTTTNTTSFTDGQAKLTGFCAAATDRPFGGDFDNDGRSDLGCRRSDGTLFVALATSNGFATPTTWGSGWCAGAGDFFFSGDFDGNGASDLGCRVGNDQRVLLSTGSGFTGGGSWKTGWCSAADYQYAGDFDGDGRTDLACRTAAGNQHVLLSTGTGFNGGGVWLASWCRTGDGNGIDGVPLP